MATATHEARSSLTTLVRSSALLLSAGFAAAVINYAFQLAAGRLLPPHEFGVLGALLALLSLGTLPIGALQTGVVHFAATHGASAEAKARLLGELKAAFLFPAVLLAALVLAATPWLAAAFEVPPILLLGLALAVGLSLGGGYYAGVVQGTRKFGTLSFVGILGAALKLLVGGALLLAGWGAGGAFGGVLAGLVAAVPVFARAEKSPALRRPTLASLRRFAAYVAPTFLTMAGFAALSSVDLLAVKAYFSAEDAGAYTAAATLGKFLLLVPTTIATVLFAMLPTHDRDSGRRLALRAILINAALCALASVPLLVAPGVVLSALLGAKFARGASWLPYYALSMVVIGTVQLAMTFFLGTRRPWAGLAVTAFAALEIVVLVVWHPSPASIISVQAACGVGALAAFLAWLLFAPEAPEVVSAFDDDARP